MAQSKADYDLKQAVRFVTRTYVKVGRLPHLRCQRCGSKKSEIHHPDYSKLFDIVWLCRRCHAKEHVREYARPRARDGKFRPA